MTRRGHRTHEAEDRRLMKRRRNDEAAWNGVTSGMCRWERKHGEMGTYLRARCSRCGSMRLDVESQRCNLKHLDGCYEVVALMLAAASYGRCWRCRNRDVVLYTSDDNAVVYKFDPSKESTQIAVSQRGGRPVPYVRDRRLKGVERGIHKAELRAALEQLDRARQSHLN